MPATITSASRTLSGIGPTVELWRVLHSRTVLHPLTMLHPLTLLHPLTVLHPPYHNTIPYRATPPYRATSPYQVPISTAELWHVRRRDIISHALARVN